MLKETDLAPVRRALISVSDKAGLEAFAHRLSAMNIEILSTGGTSATLRKAGVAQRDVAEITQFPEMMDGRIKTLHPRVHGGLLAIRANAEHQAATIAHSIPLIDLLVVNLYPFEAALQRGAPYAEMVENIDIGGPAMIRGAAKNHVDVVVIVDVEDYGGLLDELQKHEGATRFVFRQALAQRAFARTASYDAAISNWMARDIATKNPHSPTPTWRAFGGRLSGALRYGENPHQSGAFYRSPELRRGAGSARQVQGKSLSYNNINDTDAAYELVAEFDPKDSPAVAIIKHANPCGVAIGATLADAYAKALACDPVSAFGGVIALNQRLDAQTARLIVEIFTEVIIAPDADPDSLEIIARKKGLRLLLAGALPDPAALGLHLRSVAGGFLVQDRDFSALAEGHLKIVTKRAPSATEMADLLFAWRVAKHVKSNAIVYAKGGATVGIGAGQMSRVDSARIAAHKSAEATAAADLKQPLAKGSVVASDAFFPFADGLLQAISAGATAAIQPGGSVRDAEIIAAADQNNLAMVFTGIRNFRH